MYPVMMKKVASKQHTIRNRVISKRVNVPYGCARKDCEDHLPPGTLGGCLVVCPWFFNQGAKFNLSSTLLLNFLRSNIPIGWRDPNERRKLDGYARGLIRQEAGGVCEMDDDDECSSSSTTLEFHHEQGKVVQYYIGQLRVAKEFEKRSTTIRNYRLETKKCMLLCKKHHRSKHTNAH